MSGLVAGALLLVLFAGMMAADLGYGWWGIRHWRQRAEAAAAQREAIEAEMQRSEAARATYVHAPRCDKTGRHSWSFRNGVRCVWCGTEGEVIPKPRTSPDQPLANPSAPTIDLGDRE